MPTSSHLLLALLALAGGACNHFGLGTPYPNAASRYREFSIYRQVGTSSTYVKVGEGSETGGGGRFGGVAGIRLGGGPVALGERPAQSGLALDARIEVDLALSRRLGVGLTGGWGFTGASFGGDELVYRYFPVTGHVSWAPLAPFLLRATVGFQRGTAELTSGGSVTSDDGAGLIYGAAAGLTVPFPGAHFVVLLDYQHLSAGTLDLGAGSEALATDAILWELWYIL